MGPRRGGGESVLKFVISELALMFSQRELRQNLSALIRYLIFLAAVIVVYSVGFHALMAHEGQDHTWLTGFYWTLTVMSTLGFGDITFHSDLGRLFSIAVLLSGVVLLLIVLPFVFIRSFYAPWLEAQLRLRAPRAVPETALGHVIVCAYDEIARGLARRLDQLGVPHFVLEPDNAKAAALHGQGVPVICREIDSAHSYEQLRAREAHLLVANLSDAVNTNVALTVREVAPDLPVFALARALDSVDVIELSGATQVFPLVHRLGEYLASRVNVGTNHALEVGQLGSLRIAEFPVHGTQLVGRSLRDTRLRALTGLNVVACWERGVLHAAGPDTVLTEYSVPVVVGSAEQLLELDAMFAIYEPNENPVLVIGGGTVGRAAARALRAREVKVHILERDPALRDQLAGMADRVFIGDAADRHTILDAGIENAPTVVLTTAEDATNIFLTLYCRRLNPDTRIVSRISRDRNLEAIHRAGADYVLSQATLAVRTVMAQLLGRELVLLGEGVELYAEDLPLPLAGRSLADAQIRERSGLNVVAVERGGIPLAIDPEAELEAESRLYLLGTADQLKAFRDAFSS
jgi:Trk K+ transport system NAD-binding subunit